MAEYQAGTAYVQIIPSLRGFAARTKAELSGIKADQIATITPRVDTSAAARAKAELAALSKEVAAAQAAEAAASNRVTSARNAEATAAGKLRVAESQLNELRTQGTAKTTQVVAAEEKLSTARNAESDAAGKVRVAETQLDDLRAKGNARAAQVVAAEERLNAARNAEAAAAGKTRVAEAQLGDARAQGKARTDQVVAAEEKLNQARRQLEVAQRGATASTADLDRARARSATATANLESGQRRLSTALGQGESVSRRFGAALSSLGQHRSTLSGLDSAVSTTGASMVSLAGSSLRAAGAVAAIGGAIPIITGLTAAVADLAKGVLLLPGAFSVAAAAASTLGVGSLGVVKALQEQGKAQNAVGGGAVRSAKQQAGAADQVRSARESLRSAIEGEARAREQAADTAVQADQRIQDSQRRVRDAEQQLTDAERTEKEALAALTQARLDAKRAMEDLANRVIDGNLAERQAVIDLRNETANLNKVRADPTSSKELTEQAQLNYDRQAQSLREIRLENQRTAAEKAASDRAGIEGSQQVVSAQRQIEQATRGVADATDGVRQAQEDERRAYQEQAKSQRDSARQIADAQRQVADAQRGVAEAMRGTGAAAGGASGAVNKFQSALAKLSPSARDFVTSIGDVKKEFNGLKLDVQERLFAGLGGEVRSLAGQYLPTLRTGMVSVAGAFNFGAKQLAGFFKEAQTQRDVGTIFASTTKIVHNFGLALRPILDGLRDIGTVGAQYLGNVSGGFVTLAERFRSWASEARSSGRLMDDFKTFGDTLRTLGQIAGNVGSIFATVFKAANISSAGFLGTVKELTGQVATFLKSGEGQSALLTVFSNLRQVTQALEPALGSILSALARGFGILAPELPGVARSFASIVTSLTPLIPMGASLVATILPPLLKIISELGPALPVVAIGFGLIVTAVKGALIVSKLVDGFTKLKTAAEALNLTGASRGISSVGKAAGEAGTAAEAGGGKLARLGGAATKVGGVIGILGTVVLGAKEGIQAFTGTSDELAAGLAKGGAAAEKATQQMRDNATVSKELNSGFNGAVLGATGLTGALNAFTPTAADVNNKLKEQRAQLTNVERAQQDATKAQNDYELAVKTYGQNSPQANAALATYQGKLGDVARAQRDAADATKSHTQKMQEQQTAAQGAYDADTRLQQANIDLTKAQKDASAAIAQYGFNNEQAQPAILTFRTELSNAVTAIRAKSTAEIDGLNPTDKAKKAQDRVTDALRNMANTADKQTRPIIETFAKSLGVDLRTQAQRSADELRNLQTTINNVLRAMDGYARAYKRAYDFQANHPFGTPGGLTNPMARYLGGPTAAYGTVIPGYAPGVDKVRILASPGESVLVPELTRAIGPSNIMAANARASAHRRFSFGGIVQRFAGGGIVKRPQATPATTAPAKTPTATDAVTPAADLTATTTATTALTTATTALNTATSTYATTITGTLTPALTTQELHAGTLSTAAVTKFTNLIPPLQQRTQQLAGTINQSWQGITSRIVTSHNTMSARQGQAQQFQAQSWAAIAGSVDQSVARQNAGFNRLGVGLAGARAAIGNTAATAQSRFAAMMQYAASPVRWIIANPINAGLIAAWNSINSQFALGKVVRQVPVGFSGGGYTGDGDATDAAGIVHKREFVIQAPITRYAQPFLEALNDPSHPGHAEALQATGGPLARIKGYMSGGLVANTGSAIGAIVGRTLGWLKAQAGKPYVWGAVGPRAYDCSGLVSAAAGVARGEGNPYHRLGQAASQPWPGFVSGLTSLFGTGFNSHHTAMTLSGVNAEARQSGVPILVGGGASGATSSQFTGHASLPVVGGKFIPGGPGGGIDLTAIVNEAFGKTRDLIAQGGRLFGNNIAALDGLGIANYGLDRVQKFANDKIAEVLALSGDVPGSGVQRWAPLVLRALAMVGQPASLLGVVLRRMQQESGGNPTIQNNWDVNAKRGTPSRGLMQLIQPTFDSNWDPRTPHNILNPLSNVLASFHYAIGRYGSLAAAFNRKGGYDGGGIARGVGILKKEVIEPERMLSPRQTVAFDKLVDWAVTPEAAAVYSRPAATPRILSDADIAAIATRGASAPQINVHVDGSQLVEPQQIANEVVRQQLWAMT